MFKVFISLRNLPAEICFPFRLLPPGCSLHSPVHCTRAALDQYFSGRAARKKEDVNGVYASVNGLFSTASNEPVSQEDSVLFLS